MIFIKGSDIRQQRHEAGMSLHAVSALSGVDPGLLSRYERGEYEPSGEAQRAMQMAITNVRVLQNAFAPARLDTRDIAGSKIWFTAWRMVDPRATRASPPEDSQRSQESRKRGLRGSGIISLGILKCPETASSKRIFPRR